jgi:putative flippase GtrA
MVQRLLVFGKAQVSAFLGGIVDYLLMIFITEFFGVHYTISIVFGGIAGAIINFSVNRQWTFITVHSGNSCQNLWLSYLTVYY